MCGRVGTAHGVRGWIRVFSYTQPHDNLLQYRPWQLACGETRCDYELEESQTHSKALIVKLHGIDDRDQALALRGQEIWVNPAQFPDLPEGEYYHHQLIGLQAFDQNDQPLGTVHEVLKTPMHDVLLIQGETERLIPYVWGETVLQVRLQEGSIDVRWDGVLE